MRAEKAQRRHRKEQDIARCVQAGYNRSDVEAELKLKDLTKMGHDVISSKEERGREVTTSTLHHEPMAMSTNGGPEVERHGDVPAPSKRVVSSDAVGEQEAKRMRSPHPSEASPVLSPTTPGTVR
jgi:hypothetical protein